MRSAVALLLLALLPATAGAGGVPVLSAGAAMEVERAAHTATLLQDGGVLIAGGASIVERFTRSRFTPVARLDASRYSATATLLRGGALLIVGGYDRSIALTARSFLYRR